MNNKKICPICGQPLQEGDDLVVCPDCGTPHHRTCWKAHGQCGCPELHASAAPVPPEPDTPENSPEHTAKNVQPPVSGPTPSPKVCPYCRADNDADARFCHQCGHPLLTAQDLPDGIQVVSDPLGGIAPDEQIDGVPAKDIAEVVGPRSAHYLRIFSVLNKVKRAFPLNLTVLFFDIPWFFTRKMYLQAIGITLVELALAAPAIWGVVMTAIAGEALHFSDTFWTLYNLCRVLPWIFRIVLALFSNRMYMSHCVEKARTLREKHPDDEGFRTAARKKGGRSTFFMYTTCGLTVLYMLFTMWSGISF